MRKARQDGSGTGRWAVIRHEKRDPTASDAGEIPAPIQILSPDIALDRMREQYGLTRRETDVLAELVLTEDKQTVISERLSIQVKTLQDYVTRLYRKTGVKTRSGLTELYHRNRIDGRQENAD